jgi:hypothetical protein
MSSQRLRQSEQARAASHIVVQVVASQCYQQPARHILELLQLEELLVVCCCLLLCALLPLLFLQPLDGAPVLCLIVYTRGTAPPLICASESSRASQNKAQ